MKYVRREFKAYEEIYLFVHERTFVFRDLPTPDY